MNWMSRFLPLAVVLIMSVTGCAVLDGGDPYADEPATDKDAAASPSAASTTTAWSPAPH